MDRSRTFANATLHTTRAIASTSNLYINHNAKAPKLELKPILVTLKYNFFYPVDSFPMIIASNLVDAQDHKLLDVLREHKEAIGWIIDDIKGISSSAIMHKIRLEENVKPSWELQRRLNPLCRKS